MHTVEQIAQFKLAASIELKNALLGFQTAHNFMRAAEVPKPALDNVEQLRKATAAICDRWEEFTSPGREEAKQEQPKPATPAKPAAAPRPPAKKAEGEETHAAD